MYSGGQFMNNAKPVQFMQGPAYLGRGSILANTASFECECKMNKGDATNWVISRYIPSQYDIKQER